MAAPFPKPREEDNLAKCIYLINREELDEAKKLLDGMIRKDPEDMQLHYLFGVYYVKKENFRAAISHLLKVIDSSISTIYMPQAVKILVFSYIRLNNYEIAQSLIEEALDKYFQDLQLQNMLAYILYEEQDYRQCLKVYRDVLKKDRENVTALNGMGYCLIEHLARYEEGLDFCLQALKKSPEDPSILDSVGWGYFKMGQYKEAELYLKQAFELMPENPIIKKHVTMAVEAS